jgi:hypothetical protein
MARSLYQILRMQFEFALAKPEWTQYSPFFLTRLIATAQRFKEQNV